MNHHADLKALCFPVYMSLHLAARQVRASCCMLFLYFLLLKYRSELVYAPTLL